MSLIEELEKAEGPSRELLEAVYVEIYGADWAACNTHHASRFGTLLDVHAWEQAALTLVPEGWGWRLTQFWKNLGASVELSPGGFMEDDFEGRAKTPAIAICIAALRARETTNGTT